MISVFPGAGKAMPININRKSGRCAWKKTNQMDAIGSFSSMVTRLLPGILFGGFLLWRVMAPLMVIHDIKKGALIPDSGGFFIFQGIAFLLPSAFLVKSLFAKGDWFIFSIFFLTSILSIGSGVYIIKLNRTRKLEEKNTGRKAD